MAIGPQRLGQRCDLAIGEAEGLEVGQLAADMHINPDDHDTGQSRGAGIDFTRLGDGNSEFVFRFAGGDLGVGLGINVGVHPHRNGRNNAQRRSHLAQRLHLGFAFNVELADAALKRDAHLLARFGDAGKHDPLTRNARRLGPQVFSDRHHVDPRTRLPQDAQDGDVGKRLHRKANKMRHPSKGLIEEAEMAQERGGRVDIDRRPDRGRDFGYRHVFGKELTVAIEKVVHARL